MRFVSVRSRALLLILTLFVVAAVAVAGPREHEYSSGTSPAEFPYLASPSDASGYQHRIRSGTSSARFTYMIPSSDASGYYNAEGYFESVENYDGNGTPAYRVYWYSYNQLTGEYAYASGYAPWSAVRARGDVLSIDFDASTMVGGWSWPVPTTWTGTFTAYESGPYSWQSVVSGNQSYRDEYYCVSERRLSGTTNAGTSSFAGTCGAVVVPVTEPSGYPNGRWEIFRGTGWSRSWCPP